LKRRNRQDLIEVFKMCDGLLRLKLNELFILDDNIRGTKKRSWKLVKFSIFYSDRAINRWNQLDQRAVVLPASILLKGVRVK